MNMLKNVKEDTVVMYHFDPNNGDIISCRVLANSMFYPRCVFTDAADHRIEHYDTADEAAEAYQVFKNKAWSLIAEDDLKSYHKQEYDLKMQIHSKHNSMVELSNDWKRVKKELTAANLPKGIVKVDKALLKSTKKKLENEYEEALEELNQFYAENSEIVDALVRDRVMFAFDSVMARVAENRPRVKISVSQVGP